ncbi:MAG: hypothetical protein H0W71_08640 [Sphingomonas sp.]|nr:hypothetical protein [Sphingomonas sp.]
MLRPGFGDDIVLDLEIEMVFEGTSSAFADIIDHYLQTLFKSDLGLDAEQAAGLVGRTIGEHDLLRPASGILPMEVEIEQLGDHDRKLVDGNKFIIRADVDDFADNRRFECHLGE